MKTRKHKVLDHPILGYFLLVIWGMMVNGIGSLLDTSILAKFIPGYAMQVEFMGKTNLTASGVMVAVVTLLALLIHKKWFAPNYKGMLTTKNLKMGLILLIPVIIAHWVGSFISIGAIGIGSIGLAFLRAFSPAFGEEMMFRGLGISNFMRTIKSEKKIYVIFWLSSLVFGFTHASNTFNGASLSNSLIQSLAAVGLGLLLGAVYLRTGNLWTTIIAHYCLDFMEFTRADLTASGGVMQEMLLGDKITVAVAIIAGIFAIYLMRKSKLPEIMEVWNEKWGKSENLQE